MQDFYYIFQFIASNFASSMPNGIYAFNFPLLGIIFSETISDISHSLASPSDPLE
jgi:hypothetical protein